MNIRSVRHAGAVSILLWAALVGGAQAGCMDQRLLGVNLSGAEFGSKKLPGVLFKDYIYPSRASLSYFKRAGMNVMRVPFRWERIQRRLYGPLDTAELEQLRRVVAWGRELDLCILLDLHNYGAYKGQAVGSTEVPVSAFIDVWQRLYQAFDNPSTVAFGLMNEPAAVAVPQWLKIAQKTVFALRRAGASNLLMVPSGRWSGAHEWTKTYDGVSAAVEFRNFTDPLDNYVIELHQYADPNFSGTGSTCIAEDRLRKIMDTVTSWAIRERRRFFLGEFGTNTSPECMAALRTLVESMQDGNAWLGWAYWSAGPWWGGYPNSIQPIGDKEAAQLTLLRKFLPK